MSATKLTVLTGYGSNQTTFSGALPALNLAQGASGGGASGVVGTMGRNEGVAVGADGEIYLAATFAQVVGRIDAPSSWQQVSLPPGFTSTVQALSWKVISTTSTPVHTLTATTVDGQPAVRWQSPSVPANAWLYAVPSTFAGAVVEASVTVRGTGVVYLDLYNGSADIKSAAVTLSDTPQTLSVSTTMTAGNPEFQIRTPIAQTGIDVTIWNPTITQSAVTGLAHPVAGVFNTPGYSGDGGPGDRAELNFPGGLAVAPDGTVYIADTYNHRIRRVDPQGRITTVAGTATLNRPGDVAVAPDGTVYIADTYNNRIRRLDPKGQVVTIAGSGVAGYSGDGGLATAAALNHPGSVAVGADGTVYIADTYNNRIRVIAANGQISTVAGTGTAGYSGDSGPATGAGLFTPQGIALDGAGNLYIADTLNQRIRAVTTDGTITTVAGTGVFGSGSRNGGAATSAQLAEPLGVAVTSSGSDMYIVGGDQSLMRVTGLAL
jgi:streptogramin lyase